MGDMLKQVQKMQQKMVEIQEELNSMTEEGTAGGGIVKVTATGKGDITEIKIEPEAVDPDDIEMLEDLILAAVFQAKYTSTELQQEQMSTLTVGIKIPGMPGLPF